jgi:hypothetical protein
MRPFYFGVVLWGEEFRGYFLDYCLPSLLAPGNIPALENKTDSRFLICTTRADWEAMQNHPTYALLKRAIEPVLIEMSFPADSESKMRAMSLGHKAIAEEMHRRHVYGTFVYPDTIFADGVVAEAQRLAKQGKKVVLAHCPRFANEGLLSVLIAKGLAKPGQPIALSARKLMDVAIPHMHSEMLHYEWKAPYFHALSPALIWWRLPGGGLLMHTLAWAPMLVDYSCIAAHDTTAMDEWTIDGDYIHKNFPDPLDVHAVTDSDAMTLMSFTPESSLTFLPLQKAPDQSFLRKVVWLNGFLLSSHVDSLKRELFRCPILVGHDPHGHGLSRVVIHLRAAIVVMLVFAPRAVMSLFRVAYGIRRVVYGRIHYLVTYPVSKMPDTWRRQLKALVLGRRSG